MITGMPRANAQENATDGGGSRLAAEVQRFLSSCPRPSLVEPGEPLLELAPGRWTVAEQGGRVTLEAWDNARSFSRRLTGIRSSSEDRLELHTERFGKHQGRLVLTARGETMVRRAARDCSLASFGERLGRQFPAWTIDVLTHGADLEHSLSPAYPRALLRQGPRAWAAIAAPAAAATPENALTFGLAWLDYLRRRPAFAVEGLAVFVPERAAGICCLRVRYFDPRAARFRIFACSAPGETEVDPFSFGNVDTRIERAALDAAAAGHSEDTDASEHALELLVRDRLESLDARLLPSPVYRQAAGTAGCDRGIPDLLAADRDGRLTVVELKASEDIHLPLQALDYWIRVKWHLDRGEFTARGYFPGLTLRTDPPRLLLVAPALAFHPLCDSVLSFFDPSIDVARIGLGLQWRKELKILFRKEAARPIR